MGTPCAEFLYARPDHLEAVFREAPVAFGPLGTYEHHGWHLPPCYDGIKAYEICRRGAERTGGVVFPTLYYGIGGGHVGYKWTTIVDEEQVRPLVERTLDDLVKWGFRVVVLYTGHYAGEPVRRVPRLADERVAPHPLARFSVAPTPQHPPNPSPPSTTPKHAPPTPRPSSHPSRFPTAS